MKRLFTLIMLMSLFVTRSMFAQETVQPNEEPIFTFACLSDLHSQQTLISGSVETVKLRGTIQKTLDAIKKEENIDLIVLGGDYLSDVTIPLENYYRTRELLVAATRNTFPKGSKTPVIYVNGNHEYEVANFDNVPKGFNAGDYYSVPMKTDIGALADEDCFYEMASNGTSDPVNLLAAYHYVINGFDFVVLNTGKNFFQNAWNYTYSDESIEWVGSKLEEIYAENPNKTVFFLVHLPFGDSNSISATNKGMTDNCAELLKPILAQYPNLVMLYGHDHGKDSAYIRENTAQRVTQYDSNGNIWVAPVEEEEEEEGVSGPCNIQNYNTGKYLGFNSVNMANTDEATSDVTVTTLGNGYFNFHLTGAVTQNPYLYCGSNGRFSGNEDPTNASSQVMAFEVEDPTAATITAIKASKIVAGKTYLLVGTKNGKNYALTNEMYKEGDKDGQRMVGLEVTINDNKITYTPSGNYSALWTFAAKQEATVAPALCNIQNYNTGKFLGFNSYNMANTNKATSDVTITASSATKGAFSIHLSGAVSSNPYLYCGSSGRFSGNSDAAHVSSQILVFEVEDPTAATITAVKAAKIVAGKTYLLVGIKDSKYYALTNQMHENETSNQRMVGLSVTIANDKITYTPSGNYSALWTINEQVVVPEEPGTPSFFSAFMGSMRYYSNSIEGGSSVNDSRIIQALMVYVYTDRVELKMKNYGESGTINGITINKDLTPYVSYRTVEHSAVAVTAAPAFAASVVGGEVELGQPISLELNVPEWHNVYYTTDGSTPTEASAKVENGKIVWTPETKGEYVVKIAAQEGVRLLSQSVESPKFVVKDDITNSIENIEAVKETTIYTITGKAVQGNVNNLEKGLYIVNGKKLLIK